MIGNVLESFQRSSRFVGILHEKDETLSMPFVDLDGILGNGIGIIDSSGIEMV